MSIDRRRVRDVFLTALEQPRHHRMAYVQGACRDEPALLAEVESLLAHDVDAPLVAESAAGIPLASLTQGAPRVGGPDETTLPRYKDMNELGRGGFGVVVRRYDRTLRREVARKAPLIVDDTFESALMREARLLAYLEHPGVVQVFDADRGDDGATYTMELLRGKRLSDRLDELRATGQRMSVSEARRVLTRVAETVANAHAKGVLHLDLKPDNIMLQSFGRVTVIDWGMAHVYDAEPYQQWLDNLDESQEGALATSELSGGTPLYMPPEQFADSARVGRTADIYALGATLFELLTGEPPFVQHQSMADLLEKKQAGAPPVGRLRPGLSSRLENLCTAMLAPSPKGRPASLEIVLDELAALSEFGGAAQTIELDPGEPLFEQGDDGTSAYMIVEGALSIIVDGEDGDRVIATRGPGEIVGELALISETKRSATVRAAEPTTVRALDWPALKDELSKVDPIISTLLRHLSDKLVETTSGDD